MNNYGNASEGLQKMFIAQVCLYHMQRAVCHSDHQSAGNYWLYNAGKDINGCANAFVLSIISLVCNIISSLTSFNVLFAMLFSVAAAVLTFMVTYQVCTSVSDVVGSRGHNDIASLGKSTWIVFLIGSILNVVVAIVAVVIPFADVIIVGMSVVSTMVQIHCTAFLCDIPKQEFCGSF